MEDIRIGRASGTTIKVWSGSTGGLMAGPGPALNRTNIEFHAQFQVPPSSVAFVVPDGEDDSESSQLLSGVPLCDASGFGLPVRVSFSLKEHGAIVQGGFKFATANAGQCDFIVIETLLIDEVGK